MDSLTKSTLSRLRDQLRERGQRPSVVLPGGNLPPNAVEILHVTTEYGALCEAMYLMMAADGRVLMVEREVLKGALRVISDDTIRGVHVEAMIDAATKRLAAEGLDARLGAIVEALHDDPIKSEVALVLAAAVAYADDEFAPEESDLLGKLAKALDIDDARANELLEGVERDISAAGRSPERG